MICGTDRVGLLPSGNGNPRVVRSLDQPCRHARTARLPPSTWPVFGGDGGLASVEGIPYYTIHDATPLFLQSVLSERILHCFRSTTAYLRRLAASRSAIAINVVRFVETFHTDFRTGTSWISPPVTLHYSSRAERDDKEKGVWRTRLAKS